MSILKFMSTFEHCTDSLPAEEELVASTSGTHDLNVSDTDVALQQAIWQNIHARNAVEVIECSLDLTDSTLFPLRCSEQFTGSFK